MTFTFMPNSREFQITVSICHLSPPHPKLRNVVFLNWVWGRVFQVALIPICLGYIDPQLRYPTATGSVDETSTSVWQENSEENKISWPCLEPGFTDVSKEGNGYHQVPRRLEVFKWWEETWKDTHRVILPLGVGEGSHEITARSSPAHLPRAHLGHATLFPDSSSQLFPDGGKMWEKYEDQGRLAIPLEDVSLNLSFCFSISWPLPWRARR